MKQASQALETLLESGVFVQTDLYTFTLVTGIVLRYTTADLDITDGTNTWTAKGPYLDEVGDTAARGHWKVGLDVDSWQIKVLPRSIDAITGTPFPDQIAGLPWLQAARAGALDGATLQVDRAYATAWPQPWVTPFLITPPYILKAMFYGRVATVDVGLSYAIVNANDFRELLTIQMPRNVYSAYCRHTLFDVGCQLNAATFAVNGAVIAGSSTTSIIAALPQAAGYFSLGRIVFTSGKNNGFSRGIRSWDGVKLVPIAPLPFPVAAGDTFTVYPGCNKTTTTCTNTFGNLANFGGQPFIPSPDA